MEPQEWASVGSRLNSRVELLRVVDKAHPAGDVDLFHKVGDVLRRNMGIHDVGNGKHQFLPGENDPALGEHPIVAAVVDVEMGVQEHLDIAEVEAEFGQLIRKLLLGPLGGRPFPPGP